MRNHEYGLSTVPDSVRTAVKCWLAVRWRWTLQQLATGKGEARFEIDKRMMDTMRDHPRLKHEDPDELLRCVHEILDEAKAEGERTQRTEVLVGLYEDYREAKREFEGDLELMDAMQWSFQTAAEALGFTQEDLDEYTGTKSAVQMLQTRLERDEAAKVRGA